MNGWNRRAESEELSLSLSLSLSLQRSKQDFQDTRDVSCKKKKLRVSDEEMKDIVENNRA
jgi:hypothetical protein